jgi:uncharacterized protein (DUF2249 family)/iron-sulfur cluster repair protein YtfE (RIC family)
MEGSMSHLPADDEAAAAVVRHHAQLAGALRDRVDRLLEQAERGGAEAEQVRQDLLAWLQRELVPHALAEERTLYPAAAARPRGALLVDGMLGEHRTITGLVAEIASASSLVRAAAAARALDAVFATHLAKENDLVVPLLVEAGDVSLAALLEGMHTLLGDHEAHGEHGHGEDGHGEHGHGEHGHGEHGHGEHGHGEHGHGEHGHGGDAQAREGCGGGPCGCGGDAGRAGAEAAVLTIDPRLDVRQIPHSHRHAAVLSALDTVPPGGALVLVAPHAPRPLLAEIRTRYGGQFGVDWLQNGPDVWQVRLERVPAAV